MYSWCLVIIYGTPGTPHYYLPHQIHPFRFGQKLVTGKNKNGIKKPKALF